MRRVLCSEAGEQLVDLAEQADAAQGGEENSLARVSLEDDGLVAVDPFPRATADLDRRQVVKPDPQSVCVA
jgi:hypothetical protein